MVWYGDEPEFLNNPIKYIGEHPENFSQEVQAMAKYQLQLQSLKPWGEMPTVLDESARLAGVLQQKSVMANELADIIMRAEQSTLQTFANDATFEEKKALFQNLAAMPADNNGMLAIYNVISQTDLPLMSKFEQDLQIAEAKVKEANAALQKLENEYTTLFLSVRKVATLAGIAAWSRQ